MREAIDFNYVPTNQTEIHERLVNWARWCRPGHHSSVLAMFKGYRPYLYPESEGGGLPINSLEAVEVQKTMIHVPEKNRIAVQWCYVIRSGPVVMARHLGVSKAGLLDLVTDGRAMIKNRLLVKELA